MLLKWKQIEWKDRNLTKNVWNVVEKLKAERSVRDGEVTVVTWTKSEDFEEKPRSENLGNWIGQKLGIISSVSNRNLLPSEEKAQRKLKIREKLRKKLKMAKKRAKHRSLLRNGNKRRIYLHN